MSVFRIRGKGIITIRDAYYLGVDLGSVSTNLVLMDNNEKIIQKVYLRTDGRPINAIRSGIQTLTGRQGIKDITIKGTGTTGSGRKLAGVIIGADIVKNEITVHAVAALKMFPDVRTVFEIGGQDSKIILLRDGVVYDFAMNTVCAAGTGSFLDRQAARLNIPIDSFGEYKKQSRSPVRIAGRCAVFAESDMIHKQQAGHSLADIVAGLCDALARNYLNNLAKGKEIRSPVIFQGGVAANGGMVSALAEAVAQKIHIPEHYDVMGAYGAAIIARNIMTRKNENSRFYGWEIANNEYVTASFNCSGCANACEVVRVLLGGKKLACWGGRCGKWQ